MTHSEREARLLVRVARLQRSCEQLRDDLNKAGLFVTSGEADKAVEALEQARELVMSAIRQQGEAAGRKR